MKAVNQKMEERLTNLKDALNFEEPEKVPVNLKTTTGAYGYSGKTLREVIDDPQANAEAYVKVYKDLQPDISAFGINAMAVGVFEALGATHYYLGNDDTAVLHEQAGQEYLSENFYDEISKGGVDALNEIDDRILRSRIPCLNGTFEDAVATFKGAIKPFMNDMLMKQMGTEMLDEMGIPRIIDIPTFTSDAPFWMGPFSAVLDTYRGIKEALLDLRRRPEKVQDACDIIAERTGAGLKTDSEEIKKDFEGLVVPIGMNILNAECFLSRKNFEKFYLNYFKKHLMPYIDAGAKYYIFMEGKLLSTCDMYKDLPKGSLWFSPDEDDIFEMYDKLGDHHTICAGPSLLMLKCSTKQQCIDYAKKCFDTFAPGGGYVFMHSKAITGANDVNWDTMRAVYEFANEYGRKK